MSWQWGQPWRVARSIATLRTQVNDLYPNRSKASDGTIGDEAHQQQVSDHNPDGAGVVHAFDITHDPRHGLDIGQLAEQLRDSRDPRIKYVIANRRIFAGPAGPSPFVWRSYSGTDPHTNHVHVSVAAGARGDDPSPWHITEGAEVITDADVKKIAAASAAAVAAIPVPRPGNTPVALGAQVGGANINSYRALAILRTMQGDDAELLAAIRTEIAAAVATLPENTVDVDQLAHRIVDQLVDKAAAE